MFGLSRLAAVLVLFLALSSTARADVLPPGAPERLERLARLWGEVRFRHPWVLTRGLDWDGPLLEAIPRVVAATSADEERAALAAMLASIGDPATRLLRPGGAPAPARASTARWEEGEILVARLGKPDGVAGLEADARALEPEVRRARRIVFDLREQPQAVVGSADAGDLLEMLAPVLAGAPSPMPPRLSVRHSGWRPQTRESSGGYGTSLVVEPGTRPGGDAPRRRIAFVADATSLLPGVVPVLQRDGQAILVARGVPDDSFMSPNVVDLGGGLSALVRPGEIDPPLHADVSFPDGADPAVDAPLDAALAWVRSDAPPPSPGPAPARAPPTWTPDRTWPTAQPPSLALRLLALVRLWNVIRFFDPYLALVDEPWDGQLVRHAPAFAAAETQDAYELAVNALASRLQDTHVGAVGPATRARRGGRFPAEVLPVEGRLAVVKLEPASAAAGLRIGDVVETVDGVPVAQRMQELVPYTSASTPAGLAWITGRRALAGPPGSVARVEVSGADDRRRTIEVARAAPTVLAEPAAPGLPWRTLDRNVGYVDLTRLTVEQVEPMLGDLGATTALVLDMRGYPRGVAWTLAPRLRTRDSDVAALFRRRVVGLEVDGMVGGGWLGFAQPLGRSDRPPYRGRTVMLVDERTISQAEHTGLFLEAAAGTVFVGTPSAGANGDVTDLTLPGDVTVLFTGHDVRHADGRQLQRLGLQPDVRASPTIAGLRAGRDEVLEAALRLIASPAP